MKHTIYSILAFALGATMLLTATADVPLLACCVDWLTGFTGHLDVALAAAGAGLTADMKAKIQAAIKGTADTAVEAVGGDGATYTQEQVDALVQETANEAVKAFRAAPTVEADNAAPNVITDTSHWKYDNVKGVDIAFMIEVLHRSQHLQADNRPAPPAARKALAARLFSDEARDVRALQHARAELSRVAKAKGLPFKANEIGQSTLADYGDEWVGVAYSSQLWEAIRQELVIMQMIPQFEFPAGAESMVIPLESTDPIWYNVAQASDLTSNPGGIPVNTVTASRLGTDNKTMTLGKLGARVLWTGELNEDSVIPFVSQLRRQLERSGAEYLEAAVLDGDTDLTPSTNINDIAGTPAASDWFTVFNGLRKLALVTNTANSRDGGVLTSSDFLATLKLMGVNGKNSIPYKNRVGFVVDSGVYAMALDLPEVKTMDTTGPLATIITGELPFLYGVPILVSGQIARAGGGLSNTAGKIDVDTLGNNTKGQILSARWDQTRMGFRRRLTMETTRIPAADATEIVALMRVGFQVRDNEAAAISYNITV